MIQLFKPKQEAKQEEKQRKILTNNELRKLSIISDTCEICLSSIAFPTAAYALASLCFFLIAPTPTPRLIFLVFVVRKDV